MKMKFRPVKIGKKRNTRDWTIQEEKYLSYHFGSMPTKEISKNLNRSMSSIYGKIHKLGLGGIYKNGRASRLKHDRVLIKHLIVNLNYSAKMVAVKINTNPRHIHWIVENEFEISVKKKLLENGKGAYREFRRIEAISRKH